MNIAHNAQQKLLALEKQCTDFDNEKHNLEMQLQTLQCKLDGELEKSKQLTEVVAQKEIEMNEVHSFVSLKLFCNITSLFLTFVHERKTFVNYGTYRPDFSNLDQS